MSDYPAQLYAAVHDGNPGDVEFYQRLCEGAGTIVELGCGDARVLAALAAPGRRLIGVDIDPELLALARARLSGARESKRAPDRAPESEPQIEPEPEPEPTRDPGTGGDAGGEFTLICADMREVELDPSLGPVDRVVIPYGGLYCLLEPAAVDATLARVAAMLAPDGLLILDAWAADGFHAEADPDDQDPTWLEIVKAVEIDGHRWEVLERSAWDKPSQRIDATYLHFRVGDEVPIEGRLPQRYVLAEQLRASLSAAGLELVDLHGDFAGGPYGPDAEWMIAVARRRVG